MINISRGDLTFARCLHRRDQMSRQQVINNIVDLTNLRVLETFAISPTFSPDKQICTDGRPWISPIATTIYIVNPFIAKWVARFCKHSLNVLEEYRHASIICACLHERYWSEGRCLFRWHREEWLHKLLVYKKLSWLHFMEPTVYPLTYFGHDYKIDVIMQGITLRHGWFCMFQNGINW